MAAGGFDIAKAGWLYRRSSVLHRWKKSWFVLDREGDLRYFENPDTPKAEERIVVRAVTTRIKTGPDCTRADPPEGVNKSKACFIELEMREKDSMLLCAESFDDMRAWQIALEDARTMAAGAAYPGVTHTTTIVAPPGYLPYGTPHYGYSSGYGYPGCVISRGTVLQPPPAQQIIHNPNGTTTVINPPATQQIVYVDDGPYRRRHYRGGIYPGPFFFY